MKLNERVRFRDRIGVVTRFCDARGQEVASADEAVWIEIDVGEGGADLMVVWYAAVRAADD